MGQRKIAIHRSQVTTPSLRQHMPYVPDRTTSTDFAYESIWGDLCIIKSRQLAMAYLVGEKELIRGESERAPNTRETGSGVCIHIYIYIYIYLCVILHSNDSMRMLRHHVVDHLP